MLSAITLPKIEYCGLNTSGAVVVIDRLNLKE